MQDFFNVAEQCSGESKPELFLVKKDFGSSTKKEGRKLHENIKSIVTKSLKDDKYPEIMPWSKDYVSVDKK